MKKIILLLLIVLSTSLYSQTVNITNIDASNYPEVLVEFQAYDENGDQYRTFANNSATITDSGINKTSSEIFCETRGTKFSLILQLDVSASMAWGVGSSDNQNASVGDRRWDAIIDAVDLMFNSLDPSSNEVSVMLFSTTSVLKLPYSQDFTALRTEIQN